MAIIPSALYPSQVDTDPAYPQGKARNAGSFQDGTGTPLEQKWLNDDWGFKQALLDAAAVTPSGDPDEVGASQYLDAIGTVAVAANAGAIAAASAASAAALDAANDANAAALVAATRRAFTIAALHLRELRLEGGAITDTAESLAAVALPSGAIAALKTDVSLWVSDWSRPESLAGVSSGSTIDGNVRAVARRTTDGRLVAIGTDSTVGGGGSATAISTTDGASWSTGTNASGLDVHRIVWSENADRFVISLASEPEVWLSDDGGSGGAAFPHSGLASSAVTNGLAVINQGTPTERILICGSLSGAIGRPAIRRSSDGGASWSSGAQFPAGLYTDIGCLVGDGGVQAFWAGILVGGAGLDARVTADGVTWLTTETLVPPAGTTFAASGNPRILVCPETRLAVIVAPLTSGFLALYASMYVGSISDALWVGPQIIGPAFSTNAFAVAGGRLFATRNDMIFASDGVLER
jgi:hypothetical protein